MTKVSGWFPAISGAVCLALGAGLLGVYGFFVEPLSREFGVGVAVINLGPLAILLVPGVLAPTIGKLADRLPIRRLILTGCTLSMLSLLGASQAATLWLAGLAFTCFAIGLTMYGNVVINGLMIKLYPGREARALAIAAIGISLSSATLPLLVGLALEIYSWRATLAGLSLSLLLILWLVVLRGIPADAGLAAASSERSLDKSIYRRGVFWLVGICVALGFNVSIVLAVCYPPYFISEGFSAAQAGLFLAVGGMSGLLGKTCLAWLADKRPQYAGYMAAALLLLQLLGMTILLQADVAWSVYLAMIPLGFGGGAFIPMHPYLNSRYFDAAIIGQVNGAQMPLFLPLGLLGPPLAGYVYDSTASYDLVLTGLGVVLAIATVLALCLRDCPGDQKSVPG